MWGRSDASSSRARASTPALPASFRLRQRGLQLLADALEIAGSVQGVGQLEPELEPLGRVLRQQRTRTLEEVDGRRRVSASHRPPPGGGEQLPAARGERHSRLVDALDLRAMPERLLEVVAEHLLHLCACGFRSQRRASPRTARAARPGSAWAGRRTRRS